MKYSVAFISIVLFIYSTTTETNAAPQFEIRVGNCSKAKLVDLALQKNVQLGRLPFVRREHKETYYGDYKIYCILALSQKPATENSTVEIIDGGVNRPFVTFQMKSAIYHGFNYNLSVYVNRTHRF